MASLAILYFSPFDRFSPCVGTIGNGWSGHYVLDLLIVEMARANVKVHEIFIGPFHLL